MAVENGKAAALAARTLARLVEGLSAVERTGADGGPVFAVETEHVSSRLRVFEAPGVRVVSTLMSAKQRVHDTHGVFAFTAPDSLLPHLSFDCSDRVEAHAYHVDLLPRTDLATAVAYLDEVYGPLTDAHAAVDEIGGLTPAADRLRRQALMSPWLLVHLATPDAFDAIGPTVQAYVDHWLALMDTGLSAEAVAAATASGVDLVARDAAIRRNLNDPAVDRVWARAESMLGPENTRALTAHLLGTAD